MQRADALCIDTLSPSLRQWLFTLHGATEARSTSSLMHASKHSHHSLAHRQNAFRAVAIGTSPRSSLLLQPAPRSRYDHLVGCPNREGSRKAHGPRITHAEAGILARREDPCLHRQRRHCPPLGRVFWKAIARHPRSRDVDGLRGILAGWEDARCGRPRWNGDDLGRRHSQTDRHPLPGLAAQVPVSPAPSPCSRVTGAPRAGTNGALTLCPKPRPPAEAPARDGLGSINSLWWPWRARTASPGTRPNPIAYLRARGPLIAS
jgi:hypothetical protein